MRSTSTGTPRGYLSPQNDLTVNSSCSNISGMKLYVCWGTFQLPGVRAHPCRIALEAVRGAGHEPEVIRTFSSGALPPITAGRRMVRALTGSAWVPVLVTEDEAVSGTDAIVAWSQAHPAA